MTVQRGRVAFVILLVAGVALPGLASVAAPPKPAGSPVPTSSLSPAQTALPVPSALPSAATPAPALPGLTMTATPSGTLVRFAGQILDVRNGFVFFTTGDGFRLDPSLRTDDYFTGAPTPIVPALRVYARASFDTATHRVVQLDLSRRPIPPEASYEAVHAFAVTASSPRPNPELVPRAGFSGRIVNVTFTALVPSTTNLNDVVYMETDQSGWNPLAIRLDRIDALHYRITLRLPSGSEFLYRYTRGSAQSVERARNGIEQPPRSLLVPEVDLKNQDDTVYSWADTNPASGSNSAPGPDAIPTPFNPAPFPFPVPRKTLKP
ncbi:MAG: hypothetical protein JO060_02195 [Candidatus Eremiobacteraeota bacterium]|nr:hypothetical protein [Candidatus Eremiobacteraeota bacterium]MBV9646106.1 hypothetical protein [Candidatus Eremiobacteraeota bacterium]